MSVISKDLASKLAIKATEKTRLERDRLLSEYNEVVTCFYENQTPQQVKDTFKKHPEWFYKRQYINFEGHGFGYEQIKATRNIICNSGTSGRLELTSKMADKIVSAKNKFEKSCESYSSLVRETEQALLTLKTFNNIRKEFPDLASMLPPPMSNALVVNFDSLKNRLKKQPDIKKELTVS